MDANVSNRAEPQARDGGRKVGSPSRQVFRREGEYWTVEYAGTVSRLRDGAGLRYLACLLARPGEPVPAVELVARHGRGGTAPAPPSAVEGERARVRVTRAIRAVLRRLGDANPALLEHLNATIRTGAQCAYRPDPRRRIDWKL